MINKDNCYGVDGAIDDDEILCHKGWNCLSSYLYLYRSLYIEGDEVFFLCLSFFSFLSSFHLSDCSFFVIIVFHSNAVLRWLTVSLSWEDEMFTTKKLFTYIHTSTKGDVFFYFNFLMDCLKMKTNDNIYRDGFFFTCVYCLVRL